MNKHSQKLETPAARPEPKQPVVQPSLQFTVAHFTAAELRTLQGVCRDADNENAVRYLAAAIKRADGRQ